MVRYSKWIGLLLVGLMLGGLVGCAKVTKGNYDKIQNGMTLSEVEGILGKGVEKAGGSGAIGNLAGSGKIITWGGDNKFISITFVNDKVTLKVAKGL